MKKYFIIILLLFMPIAGIAQEVPLYMTQIFLNVLSVDGYITEEIHDKFWDGLKGIGSEKEIIEMLRKNIFGTPGSLEFQKECWESAKISYQNRRVVKTQRLIDLEKNIPARFASSIFFPKGSNNYTNAIDTFDKRFKEANEYKELLLEAAASHNPMIYQGQLIDINENRINEIISKLDSTFKRLDLLLTEKWQAS